MAHGGCRPLVWVLACALLVLGLACKESTQSDPMTREPPIFDGSVAELDEAIQEAELVFEGEVISIEYANSTNNGQGELDPDADGTEDRGELPHTFVTYQISTQFKGNYENETVTLRFLGGVDPMPDPVDGYEIVEVSQYPEFDLGDQDILFMAENTVRACPIVGCSSGRLRVLTSPEQSEPRMFNELGQEVRLVERSETEARLFFIGEHQIPAINQHTITYPDGSTATTEIVSDQEGADEQDPPGVSASLGDKHSGDPPGGGPPEVDAGGAANGPVEGVHVSPSQIRVLILAAVARLYPDAPDFSDLPPAISADPTVSFEVERFADDPGPTDDSDPPVEPPARDQLEELEAAAAERADLEADNVLSPTDVATIIGRRQALTGIEELPNEDDGTAEAENMWTEVQR